MAFAGDPGTTSHLAQAVIAERISAVANHRAKSEVTAAREQDGASSGRSRSHVRAQPKDRSRAFPGDAPGSSRIDFDTERPTAAPSMWLPISLSLFNSRVIRSDAICPTARRVDHAPPGGALAERRTKSPGHRRQQPSPQAQCPVRRAWRRDPASRVAHIAAGGCRGRRVPLAPGTIPVKTRDLGTRPWHGNTAVVRPIGRGGQPLGLRRAEGRTKMTTEIDVAGLEVLDRDECLHLLTGTDRGRVAITVGALPWILPVRFVVNLDRVVLGAAIGSTLERATRGTVVAFEAEHSGDAVTPEWSVTLIGVAREADAAAEAAFHQTRTVWPWRTDRPHRVITIEPTHLSGRRNAWADGVSGSWRSRVRPGTHGARPTAVLALRFGIGAGTPRARWVVHASPGDVVRGAVRGSALRPDRILRGICDVWTELDSRWGRAANGAVRRIRGVVSASGSTTCGRDIRSSSRYYIAVVCRAL